MCPRQVCSVDPEVLAVTPGGFHMENIYNVELVVREDHYGRIGTVSVKGRANSGWFLQPAQLPLWIQLLASRVRPSYPPHTGQGQLLLREVDSMNSDKALKSTTLLNGHIVAAVTPPTLIDERLNIELFENSIIPWVYSPNLETDCRKTEPELFEGPAPEVLLNVWYPVEIDDDAASEAFGAIRFDAIAPSKIGMATLRYVTFLEDPDFTPVLIRRFGRPVGRVIRS
jgi:hypothetical protein